jgi:hypothetical protein
MSKSEVVNYYSKLMDTQNFENISQAVINIFQLITQNSKKMQDNGNTLNVKLK